MNHSKNVSELMNKGKEYIQEEGHQALKQGKEQIKEAGKDWWAYVESHPLQTLIFGVIGFFALKGMMKD